MATEEQALVENKKACYAVFKAHDARFDGRIFVGVTSTGVYCRPICRVRMPKEENCTFHTGAAAAEAAGFRPCLKCRPELAPGHAAIDAGARLARRAALAVEEACLRDDGVGGLAGALGVGDRHLRRVFAREFGVSPVRYLQTRRLLLAKSLLTDTGVGVTTAAFAAGFGSLRRFNEVFRKHYRMSPTALRKKGGGAAHANDGGFTLFLDYRPPYDWEGLLAFFSGRAVPGVESVSDGRYRRTVAMGSGEERVIGWISVARAEKRHAVAVTLSPSLAGVVPRVLARVRHLFDIDCDPDAVSATLSAMNRPGFEPFVSGIRVPGCFDPFEMAVRAVLGQQITVKAARTLATRLAHRYGVGVETPFPDLTHAFPSPEAILELGDSAEARLGEMGFLRARTRSIRALAGAMAGGDIVLSPTADAEREMRRLLDLPGFGPWTVQYLAMRALGWPDAFPHTDYGVKKALDGRTEQKALTMAEAWRPWRSYATVALWASL